MADNREEYIVLSKRLSWTVIITLALQFVSVIWFARGLDARVCALEQWLSRNQTYIDQLDVMNFRVGKIADIMNKMQESQIRMETQITEHIARTDPPPRRK